MAGKHRLVPMRRREDWPVRLEAAIADASARPFSWGSHDCCLAACDCIEAMTGVDPARSLRGYKTARGAFGRLRRGGGLEKVAADLAARHGLAEIGPGFAGRGDVVLVDVTVPDGSMQPAMGIVDMDGRHVLVAGFEGGWVRLPLAAAWRAWRVA